MNYWLLNKCLKKTAASVRLNWFDVEWTERTELVGSPAANVKWGKSSAANVELYPPSIDGIKDTIKGDVTISDSPNLKLPTINIDPPIPPVIVIDPPQQTLPVPPEITITVSTNCSKQFEFNLEELKFQITTQNSKFTDSSVKE